MSPQTKRVPHRTVFVYNLDFDTSESTISSKFLKFGEIKSLDLIRDIVTGDSKGYCFIEYIDSYSAEKAYQVDLI